MQIDPWGTVPDGGLNNPFIPRFRYADGMNLYTYVRNNPVIEIDPFGLLLGKCGSKWYQRLVLPDGYGSVSWYSACEEHDKCYETCGISKDKCDLNFYYDMVGSCERAKGKSRRFISKCRDRSAVYGAAVMTKGGNAFKTARKKAGCPDCD